MTLFLILIIIVNMLPVKVRVHVAPIPILVADFAFWEMIVFWRARLHIWVYKDSIHYNAYYYDAGSSYYDTLVHGYVLPNT